MLTVTGCFLLLLLGYSTSAQSTRCFPLAEGGSSCFTQPNPPVALSWSSALQWCKSMGATLPIPDTYYHNLVYGNAVGYFGLHTETLWLSANSTFNLNNWYWANGTIFTGAIENRNIPGKTHAYILRNGTNMKFVASSPFDNCGYICQFYYTEVSCGNYYANSYWTGAKCYVKNRYSYSWYQALSNCGPTNLATIDNLNELARWFEDSVKFWIGLRSTWWNWNDIVTGTSREVTESQFVGNLPNGSSAECLASYKDNNGNIKWINQGCSRNLQFICQQYVTTTTATTTTTTTTRPTSTTTSTSTKTSIPTTKVITNAPTTSTTTTPSSETSSIEKVNINSSPGGNSESNTINYDMALGLGAGLGGGLLLAVIVWLILLTICTCRKNRETKKTLLNLQKQTAGNPKKVTGNSYDNATFSGASDTTGRQGADLPYEIPTNEQFYQPLSDEDQFKIIGGYRNTIYANAGQ